EPEPAVRERPDVGDRGGLLLSYPRIEPQGDVARAAIHRQKHVPGSQSHTLVLSTAVFLARQHVAGHRLKAVNPILERRRPDWLPTNGVVVEELSVDVIGRANRRQVRTVAGPVGCRARTGLRPGRRAPLTECLLHRPCHVNWAG